MRRFHSKAPVKFLLMSVFVLSSLSVGPTPAGAATGDVKKAISLAGTAADCGTSGGTSVALVQGSKIGQTAEVALVTSCFAAATKSGATKRATLYFTDTGTTNGTLLSKTLLTHLPGSTSAFTPSTGWAHLVHAANKGLLYGCGDDGSVYSIDYSIFTTTSDGTATAVPKPSGAIACLGLAWDPSDNTLFQSTGGSILHYNPKTVTTGAVVQTFSGLPCTTSGLSVIGGVVLVACNSGGTLYRLDKTTGAQLTPNSVTFSTSPLADLECDPVTFGLGNIDVVWSKNSTANTVTAYRVPAALCGSPPTSTVLAPASCPADPKYWTGNDPVNGAPLDTDGDGLWDCWEDGTLWSDSKPGITFTGNYGAGPPYSSANRDVKLCVLVDTNGDGVADTEECADIGVKDVFVEIDYMQRLSDGALSHKPDPQALLNVRSAFLGAPVQNPSKTAVPQGPTGVRVHVQVDEAVQHSPFTTGSLATDGTALGGVALEPCTTPVATVNDADFDALKAANFGTSTERGSVNTINAKRLAFRYMFFAHTLTTTSSGCSEIPGDDAVIALGNFGVRDSLGHKVGTTDQQGGTVMHELGHNLGLRHGGEDNVNCKPNYLSVMSYSRQFSDFVPARPLDYSRNEIDLNQTALVESFGLGTPTLPTPTSTVFAAPTGLGVTALPVPVAGSIDWSNSGGIGGSYNAIAANKPINKLVAAGCDGNLDTILTAQNDWDALQYNARVSLDFAGGVRSANEDETLDKNHQQEENSFIAADLDGDGVRDAFGCTKTLGTEGERCIIDIKPGSNPAILHKSVDSNIQVLIQSIPPKFDAPAQVDRPSLKLNGVSVVLNPQNGQGTCSAVTSTKGRLDLLCQFPSSALQIGSNFATVEGRQSPAGLPAQCATSPSSCTGFRARDFIIVVQ